MKKGFTLFEVLIVVVVLAIAAYFFFPGIKTTEKKKVEYTFEVKQTVPAKFMMMRALTVELINRGPKDCMEPVIYFNKYYKAPFSNTRSGWFRGYEPNSNSIPMGQDAEIGFSPNIDNPFVDDQGRQLSWDEITEMKIICSDGEWQNYYM